MVSSRFLWDKVLKSETLPWVKDRLETDKLVRDFSLDKGNRDVAVRDTSLAIGWCYMCPLLWVCTIFKVIFAYAIELSVIYFWSIAVFRDISKQIQQPARIGKIFARWHLGIAITSTY